MQNTSWWQNTTIYQVYPRSFYDSNSDGIGDLKGLIQKLDYLQELGVETIWCSPFFSSPQQDFGYDISDYYSISSEYGNLSDVESLIREIHARGMKIIFDLVLNHSSIQHPWFLESSSSTTNDKADWYIWTKKPNNWRSMTGGSAWQYCEARGEYYLASFLDFQADLNYRNPALKHAIFSLVRYWLEKGVDGFRLDIFNVIFKDKELRSNPSSWQVFPSEDNPFGFFQKPIYNLNQEETVALAKELRQLCNEFGDKLLLGEVIGSVPTIRRFLGDIENDGLGLVFNFEMLRFKFKASYFRKLLQETESNFSKPYTPVYVFSNHDRRRSATRLKGKQDKMKLLLSFQLCVRGVPCLYYGEELGMEDLSLPYSSALDPIPHKNKWLKRWMTECFDETINRDDLRTPMQWSSEKNAGFSAAENTWLPVHPNYETYNVARSAKQEDSLLNLCKNLLALRKKYKALTYGNVQVLNHSYPEHLLLFERSFEGERILVALNFSAKKLTKLGFSGEQIFPLHETSLNELDPYALLILKLS
ncbi:MAG: alpha-amylase family glycosyl hydrolase [Chitinophagales bacterium]